MRSLIRKIIVSVILIALAVFLYFNSSSAVTENIDNYVYDLPYQQGEAYKVVQGYGGRFSHEYKAALDFRMPEGTPVVAARGGTVYSYKDDSNEGGVRSKYAKKANYIIIAHNDGSFGCYRHLRQNGVVTKSGKVKMGQLIGYSGSTGFVLRPHLHFAVKRKLSYAKDAFVRTKFRTNGGVLLLKKGNTYRKP